MINKHSIADFVLNYSQDSANEKVLTFLDAQGKVKSTFSFRELENSCRSYAQNVLSQISLRTGILIFVEDQADFVLSFFGCLLANCIPAPMPPLRHKKDQAAYGRLLQILNQGQIKTLIVEEKQFDWVRAALAKNDLPTIEVLNIEELKKATDHALNLPILNPADIAYVQYTSGSTAAPKGVRITHQSVLANLEMMYATFDPNEKICVAGWIPFHHDMGLVGHLFTVLFGAGAGIFMPPKAFLSKPELWLQTIHDYRANIAAAPTFAYAHCVRKVTMDKQWDLSCWEIACVGSETVSVAVLNDFSEKFKAVGFTRNALRPVYGLAEATLLAAGGSRGLEDLAPLIIEKNIGQNQNRKLIPYALENGCELVVKHPETHELLKEGIEGEIFIKGEGVSLGYYANEANIEASNELATGDLGFLKNGHLYITGRKKEVIIIRGVNYAAEDLEYASRANIDELRTIDRTACVCHVGELGEELWIFQEIQRHTKKEARQDIYNQLRGNLIDCFQIDPTRIIFLPAGILPKTSNYKIARKDCLVRYQNGDLTVLDTFSNSIKTVKEISGVKKNREDDPVVVVGMACRFPGDANSPEEFWQLLSEGRDAISEVPADRWDNELFYDEKPAVPGKLNTKWAGFINDIAQFDPALFGISPYEAPEIDPQQRLLLETSWRLLENVGWKKERLAESNTGVFVGISTNDYLYIKIKLTSGLESFNAYAGLGNANSVAANRLSYFYDLKGPSLAVDTACSSSLTAFHLGTQAILNGECEQAMVGGVNAILSPGPTITLSQFGMMSPAGRCKTFDASADGYVRSEGCGLVMLKRKSAALRDGDRILAQVESSVIAQDGASNGITFPNGEAQHQLIKKGLQAGGLEGKDISYVEAHGTGTSVGDPVEMAQIRSLYGHGNNSICHVGSVKANIGHLEASAGIASVIKGLLMLEHKQIPPQIHLKTLNPRIQLEQSRLAIAQQLTDWESTAVQRKLAISSFGFGGSLAHVILSESEIEVPELAQEIINRSATFSQPLTLSAHTPDALKVQGEKLLAWLETYPNTSLLAICNTHNKGRSDLRYRQYFQVKSKNTLRQKLSDWLRLGGKPISPSVPAKICFLFTGQGEHYLFMGQELYFRFPVFKAAFDRCAAAIDDPKHGFLLKELAFEIEDTRLWSDEFLQPILFAIQYALGTLYQASGIIPQYLLGHSLGEYAAACLAGCFEPEEGMQILMKRSVLVAALPERGFMTAIFASAELVRAEMDESKAQFAAINSPNKVVVTGEAPEVYRLMNYFKELGNRTYYIKADQAFHSHLMDPMLEEFRDYLAQYKFKRPDKKWISALTGELMTEVPNAKYWCDHLRNTVDFVAATEQLRDAGPMHFIEIGPGATTLAALRENLNLKDVLLLRSLNIKKGDRTEGYFFLDSIGKLYTQGFQIDWSVLIEGNFLPHKIPGQHFMHKPYWISGITAADFTAFLDAETGIPRAIKNRTEDWHYELEWHSPEKLNILSTLPDFETGEINWLIFGAASPLVDQLLMELQKAGQQTFWIGSKSSNYQAKAKATHLLADLSDAKACKAAFTEIIELQSRANTKERRLLFVSDSTISADWNTSVLEAAQQQGIGRLIPVIKAFRELALSFPIWVISKNTQAIAPKEYATLNLGSAPLWGFCKTLFLEHPELRGGMIDLDTKDTIEQQTISTLGKINQPQFEPIVAIRNAKQFIQQLIPAPLPSAETTTDFREDGVFIITGGLGGLGLKCAEWVLEKGGKKLILLSRRRMPARNKWTSIAQDDEHYLLIQQLLKLEEGGAELQIVSLDVANKNALSNLFVSFDKKEIPVRGVIHAAGVNWFGKILELDKTQFFETLKIKVSASWELHRLTAKRDLDCFVLFSSVSALWGSVELSHYTAANQFMDMLSLYRKEANLPSLSVDWGPWADVGMSAQVAEQSVLEKLGFRLMPPSAALQAIESALQAKRPLSLIADINWKNYQPFIDFCPQSSMFEHVMVEKEKLAIFEQESLTNIYTKSPAEARQLIEEVIRLELRAVTLIESSDRIDAEHRFNFMGLDSLMALSFAVKLETYFQIKIPNTLIYNYPHIKAVTDYLFELVYLPNATNDFESPRESAGGEQAELMNADAHEIQQLVKAENKLADWLVDCGEKEQNDVQKKNVFCFPYAGSGVSVFGLLDQELPDDISLIGIQLPGREERSEETPFSNMAKLMEELLNVFPEQQADYYLLGHSMGANIAHAFVLALQQAGRKLPNALFVSGSNAPLQAAAEPIHQLPSEAFIAKVLEKYEDQQGMPERKAAIERNESLLRADVALLETYEPAKEKLKVPVVLICGKQDPLLDLERVHEWVSLCAADVSIKYIDAGHELIVENRSTLATIIESFILVNPEKKATLKTLIS